MNSKLDGETVHTLYRALLTLKTEEECSALLEDLCTITEIKSMAQRLEVAQLLRENEIYSEIAHRTGASTATISRVSRCLNYGTGGYTTVLSRLGDCDE